MQKTLRWELRASCAKSPSVKKTWRLVRDRVRSCPKTPGRTSGLRQPRLAQNIPEGYPSRSLGELERDISFRFRSFLLCRSFSFARSVLGKLATDPAVGLVGEFCQKQQIIAAKRPRRLPVAGLILVPPRESDGVPWTFVRLLLPDSGFQTTITDRLFRPT